MDPYFRFKLGQFACVCVSDGGMNYPVATMFHGLPVEEAETILRRHGLPTTHVYTPYTLLYVDTGRHKVLVDVGMGHYGQLMPHMLPGADNSQLQSGIALQNLELAGIKAEDVDVVFITHAHPDHIGGMLDVNGGLNLPNARYFIGRTEWEFWCADQPPASVPPFFVEIARDNLRPLRDRMTCLEPNDVIVPGLTTVATPGHTPGHMAVSMASGDQELLHMSDVAVHPIHLMYPDLLLSTDILPEQTLASRRRFCDRAASSGALVFAHHCPPFPSLGHIVRQADGWQWQPLAPAGP